MPAAAKVRWAKFRVVVMTISALVILSVLIFLLTGGTLLQSKETVRMYVDDATGLTTETAVRLNGVPVGRIDSIELTGSREPNRVVELRLSIGEEFLAALPEDSMGEIGTETAAGDRVLDITRGASPRPLQPGAELGFQPTPELLRKIDMAEFEARLRSLDELLADIESGKTRVGQLLKGEALYRQINSRLGELERSMERATSTTTKLGELLYRDALYNNIREPLLRLEAKLQELQGGRGAMGRLIRDDRSYEDLRARIARVHSAVADLNAGKGAGGRLLNQDEAWTAWNRRVASWMQAVDAFQAGQGQLGNMFTSASVYESLSGATRELQSTLRDFRQDPQKFVRISIF
jgi:phospholipid/cholesterol/gamma-HCH transport system substrate-binding protein